MPLIMRTIKTKRLLNQQGLAVAIATSLLFCASQVGQAQEMTYTYNGHTVSKQYYDAINLARTAEPYMDSGHYDKAEAILRQVVQAVTDNGEIYNNFALALVKNGKAKEALGYYEKSAALQPQAENLWIGWAGAYGMLGQLSESLRICKEFLKRFPQSVHYSQMANQAQSIEKEINRLATNLGPDGSQASADNYLKEGTGGTVHRWLSSAMPLTVYLKSGDKVPGWRPSYGEVMKNAFSDWAAVSNGTVSFKFVDNPSIAKIVCVWTDNATHLTNSAEQGETHASWNGKGDLTDASITMLTKPPANFNIELTDEKMRQAGTARNWSRPGHQWSQRKPR